MLLCNIRDSKLQVCIIKDQIEATSNLEDINILF